MYINYGLKRLSTIVPNNDQLPTGLVGQLNWKSTQFTGIAEVGIPVPVQAEIFQVFLATT